MFVEAHVLQNFALSNLNRDDTGAPTDCEFGGYRRARISSQCIKRSIRTYFREHALLSPENLAVRTRHLAKELAARFVAQGKPEDQTLRVAKAGLSAVSLAVTDKDRTQYLLFVGNQEIDAMALACIKHWDKLVAGTEAAAVSPQESTVAEARGARRRRVSKTSPPDLKEVSDEIQAALRGGEAADLALFGRMIADKPDRNIDAACQVAHAISTNRVNVEFDFFTAVDDIPEYDPDAGMGAGPPGTPHLHSSCYSRYANLDLHQLAVNLGGNIDLARAGVSAFLRASILAVPTGKQTGTAAHNRPSFVLVIVRDSGLVSLANAFVHPISPNSDGDLVGNSIRALVDYWHKIACIYGCGEVRYAGAISTEDLDFGTLTCAPSLDTLLSEAMQRVHFERT